MNKLHCIQCSICRGLWGLTPSGASQPSEFSLTPSLFSQKKSKIHYWPPSAFTTNRLLIAFKCNGENSVNCNAIMEGHCMLMVRILKVHWLNAIKTARLSDEWKYSRIWHGIWNRMIKIQSYELGMRWLTEVSHGIRKKKTKCCIVM